MPDMQCWTVTQTPLFSSGLKYEIHFYTSAKIQAAKGTMFSLYSVVKMCRADVAILRFARILNGIR